MSAEDNKVGLIVAVEENWGIGLKGGMPWHNPEELRHFRMATMGRVLIMGRRTVDSLISHKPDLADKVYTPQEQEVLKGRTIIVVTRKDHVRDYVRLGLYVARSLEEAITKARELEPDETKCVYLAGGGQLYKEALEKNLVSSMLISFMVDGYSCDTVFPEFDKAQWDCHFLHSAQTFTVELYTKRKDPNEPALYSS